MQKSVLLKILILSVLCCFGATTHALTLKIATIAPDGNSWMRKMRAGGKEIAKQTNNRVKFKWYPGGVMGDTKSVLKKIRIGQLHGAALTGGNLKRFYPESQIYALPLKMESYNEVDYVRQRMDSMIGEGVEKGGMVIFGIAGGGFAYPMTTDAPVTNVDEFRQRKVWSPTQDETAKLVFEAFDITPIPLPLGDVLVGLQTGLIDTVATSPVAALALQWHTQVKYVIDLPLIYVYAVLGVNQKTFKKISPEDQKIVRMVMGKVYADINEQNRKDNIAAFDVLKKRGIKVIKPTPNEMKEWKSRAMSAISKVVGSGDLSADVISSLNGHLEAARKGNSQ